jgi:putative serine protease PepD
MPAGGGFPPAGPQPPRGRPWLRGVAGLGVAAVIGGAVGGGAVALADHGRNGAVATAPSVQRDDSAAPAQATSSDGTVEGAAAAIANSVVTIDVRSGDGSGGTGSGVIVRSDGYILTNDHVVAAAGSGGVTVKFADGRTASAKVVGTDASSDLAVIKVEGVSGLTAAKFADSSKLKVGQTVVAIGSPLGLDDTVTSGIVSALHRATRAGPDDNAVIDAVQTDAAINPGNSGGALVDLAGRLVGINTSIATVSGGSPRFGQSSESGNIGIGFAIPSNTAADIADQLIAHGNAAHAYLGVQVSTSSSTSTTGGTLASVASGGPAAAAGLRAGDVVVKVGDRAVSNGDELVAAIRSYQPGDRVTLTVHRGSSSTTLTVTLGSDARQ